ncbi:MAG: lipopolysaccharide heptosyltransferase I [Acidobacteriota bacterium]
MEFKKILIVKLSSLGDIIHTLPSFYLIRKKFPSSRIAWVTEKKGSEILSMVKNLDSIIIADTLNWRKKPFSKNTLKEIRNFFKKIRNGFDLAVDFQGTVKSSIISYLSGTKIRVGFGNNNLKEPISSIFYNKKLNTISEKIHVIDKNKRLLSLIGINNEKVDSLEDIFVQQVEPFNKKDASYIILNVGANWETKRWAPEKFGLLGKRLKEKGLNPVILWGNEMERRLAKRASSIGNIPLVPYMPIKRIIDYIRNADLVVSGDTLALHISSLFSVPSVGIYGPSDPEKNGPFHKNSSVIFKNIPCSFCYKKKCKNLECLKEIQVEEVEKEVLRILNETKN